MSEINNDKLLLELKNNVLELKNKYLEIDISYNELLLEASNLQEENEKLKKENEKLKEDIENLKQDIENSEETIEDGRPLQSKRFMFSPRDGLVRVLRRPVPAKSGNGYTKKNNNKIIGGPWKTADSIAKNLKLDNGEDLYSYETLVKVIKKNLSPEEQKAIFTAFTNNNTIKDMGIPSDIQEYSKGEL